MLSQAWLPKPMAIGRWPTAQADSLVVRQEGGVKHCVKHSVKRVKHQGNLVQNCTKTARNRCAKFK